MKPVLRLAVPNDLEALLDLMRQYYAYDRHNFKSAAARKALHQLLADSSFGRVWIICVKHAPVGYIVLTLGYSLEFHGRDAFIDEFFLQEEYRRKGWGKKILMQVETTAHKLGVQAIHLEVVRDNQAANGFYRKAGYRDRDHYLMTKSLSRK
jgi:ribosomal protein S18 acetylase RimI-like enzyme